MLTSLDGYEDFVHDELLHELTLSILEGAVGAETLVYIFGKTFRLKGDSTAISLGRWRQFCPLWTDRLVLQEPGK